MQLIKLFTRYKYWILFYGVLLGLYSLLLLYLLSDGTFRINKQYYFTEVFSDMWDRLLQGQVDSSWYAIREEAFVVNQRYIAYFLPLPAFIRGALSLINLKHSAIASQILASLVFAVSSLSILISYISSTRNLCSIFVRVGLLFGGSFFIICSPITILATYPITYWESISWGSATYLCTLAVGLFLIEANKSKYLIISFYILSGLCFFTRPTFGLAALVFVIYVSILLIYREYRQKYNTNKTILYLIYLSIFIYILFGLLLGLLNYQKWGSPWVFQSIQNYTLMWTKEQIEEFLRFGNFRIDRIPESLVFYFVPSASNFTSVFPYIQPGDNYFFKGLAEHIGYRERSVPLLITIPVYLLLATVGLISLAKELLFKSKVLAGNFINYLVFFVIALIPGFLMLPFYSFAVRYQGEFLPGITVIAIYGFIRILVWINSHINGLQIKLKKIFNSFFFLIFIFLFSLSLYLGIAGANIQKSGWLSNAAYLTTTRPIVLNKKIDFCKNCDGIQYLESIGAKSLMGAGWSYPEYWGVWSDGKSAKLKFEIPTDPAPSILIMRGKGFMPHSGYSMRLDIYVNGVFYKSITLKDEKIRVINIALEKSNDRSDLSFNQVTIQFVIKNPASPKFFGIGEDSRELGFGLIDAIFK